MINLIKIELDGRDITSKVKSYTRCAEYQHLKTYDIFYLDGGYNLGVDASRVKVTELQNNQLTTA